MNTLTISEYQLNIIKVALKMYAYLDEDKDASDLLDTLERLEIDYSRPGLFTIQQEAIAQ